MCGIFGWFSSNSDILPAVAERMAELLHHRGPDDKGLEYGQGWGLGFRRLSILDLSPLGHQPMSSADGRFWIVFNGEIYNYVELRHDLEQRGEQFRSGSDTEVLLKLLARHGAQALTMLNGMFALAFIDTQTRTFLLARDRLGVKPLYYHTLNGQLRFASELKALLAWPDAPHEVDPAAIVEYLTIGYLSNETCIFKGYNKLPPGHFLAGSLDAPERSEPKSYWQLQINQTEEHRLLTSAEIDSLHELLLDAVRIRLRSDVPVGVFLSGGLDSGLVAVMAGQSSSNPPLAMTVGFNEQHFDETALARSTAERAGLEHRVIIQRSGELADVDKLAWFYDEPFGDPSALPTFALCQAASQHATVFISGDGGDEAFGGYRRYIETRRIRQLIGLGSKAGWALRSAARLLPELSLSRYRLLKLGLADQGCAAVFDGLPEDPAIAMLLHPNLQRFVGNASTPIWQRWEQSRGASLTARQQLLDYGHYLPDDILVKVDRASMAHSIEVRSPFLDYRLVEWAARLPRAALLNQRTGKLPLRTLGERLLPGNVQRGSKRGFGVPLDEWFRTAAGHTFVHERLLSTEAARLGFWSHKGVQHILELHQSQRGRDFGVQLWRLLMLDAWARHYLDRTPPFLTQSFMPPPVAAEIFS